MSSSQSNLSPVVEGRPRSRSFSSTPTFSSDLAKLRLACVAIPPSNVSPDQTSTKNGECNPNPSAIVYSYQEAIAIASTWDVLGSHSPLSRKIKLDNDEDWKNFLAVALVDNMDDQNGQTTKAAKSDQALGLDDAVDSCSNSSGEPLKNVAIDLEKLLRHCFDIAFKMPSLPPSPSIRPSCQNGIASQRDRSVSLGGVPSNLSSIGAVGNNVDSHANSGFVEGISDIKSGIVSHDPLPLQI